MLNNTLCLTNNSLLKSFILSIHENLHRKGRQWPHLKTFIKKPVVVCNKNKAKQVYVCVCKCVWLCFFLNTMATIKSLVFVILFCYSLHEQAKYITKLIPLVSFVCGLLPCVCVYVLLMKKHKNLFSSKSLLCSLL